MRKFVAIVISCFVLSACSHATPQMLPSGMPLTGGNDKVNGYKTIFSFDEVDGASPQGPLSHLNGQFYGLTSGGGNWSVGAGTVFVLSAVGHEKVLHNFGHGSDGTSPAGNLLEYNGLFYGVTTDGGKYGGGIVFSSTQSGSERILHHFGNGADGQSPMSGLTIYDGILYGTTFAGGKYREGTVFSITTGGKERILYNFGVNSGDEGTAPRGGLTVLKGRLYGTTALGGCNDNGSVFSMTTTGQIKVLHRFGCDYKQDGSSPDATLVAVKGTLYGTTYFGYGPNSSFFGAVFSVTPSGKERLLHTFGSSGDGVYPECRLLPVNGALYGVTGKGGTSGYGTVFSVTMSGKERVLYSFGPQPDGEYPYGGLVEIKGTLYGATAAGGAHAYGGAGTVFRIST